MICLKFETKKKKKKRDGMEGWATVVWNEVWTQEGGGRGVPGDVLVAVGGETVVHVAGVARHVKGRRVRGRPAIA